MANYPLNINITLTQDQAKKLEEIQKLTGSDTTHVIRAAILDLYEKVQHDEDGKQLAKINALLDVQ